MTPFPVIKGLYDCIGESYFNHDFDNVVYDEPEYDERLGMPGLHCVRKKVEQFERPICIPPELFDKYSHINFWKKIDTANSAVSIL